MAGFRVAKRPRVWIVAGIVLAGIGLVDPLEGSLAILPGTALIALGAFLGKSRRRKLLAWAFALTAAGIAIMFALSSRGGLGGSTGRSYWWALLMLPYPIGCVISLVGGIRVFSELSKSRCAPNESA